MGKSKIVFGGEVLLDLTWDTVTPDALLRGATAHGADGEPVVGACPYDLDTSPATAKASEILAGKTAGVRGALIEGTMPNRDGEGGTISGKDAPYTIPQGYHDGSGKVTLDPVEAGKLIPSNIRSGVTVLGVEGTMSGTEDAKAEARTVTPGMNAQVVTPGEEYNYLSQVTVLAIPYSETPNSAGGITATIG